jgi:asparagine synthase (glutamine-hydrolysing)
MCGIFALFGSNLPDYETIYNYFKLGKKRGPESSTIVSFQNNRVYLGFHRLPINGLNLTSDQPIYYKDYVLICNGEIFNYQYLIEKYNFNMSTESDCEVILHLFDLIGNNIMNELDGEYSFIIYNQKTHNFYVGRDPYGVRPLYMNYTDKCLAFSSDLEQLKLFNLSNVTNVCPGTITEYKNKGNEYETIYVRDIIQYETLPNGNSSNLSLEQKRENVYESLKNAVYKRVKTTERPIACLLSGGLDSSLVAALAARFYKELTGNMIETYSIGLADSEDLKFSKLVAEHIGSNHTQIICNEDEFFKAIPNVVRDVETYDTTTVRASVGNWLIGKFISEHSDAKVILNGDGADELMGGYLYFHACPNENEFDQECKRLLQNIHQFDVLRSDKSISSHGLEPRTPYLDKEFVKAYMNLNSSVRYHKGNNKPEKYVIRDIISDYDSDLLPICVLHRKKEAFSDGVSGLQRSWYEIIQSKVKDITNENNNKWHHNIPTTNEQKYYRHLFDSIYPNAAHIIPYFWMPKYVNASDASARTLKDLY